MKSYTGVNELDVILHRLTVTHDRDAYEDLRRELAEIAPGYVSELNRLYDSDSYYRFNIVGCLIGQRSKQAMELFEKAIRDKDQYTRWAAALGLSKSRSRKASALLVAALKDRSHFVKGTAVDAMARFRDPAAIPQLEKIIASSHLQKSAPGIVSSARKSLEACRRAR